MNWILMKEDRYYLIPIIKETIFNWGTAMHNHFFEDPRLLRLSSWFAAITVTFWNTHSGQ